MDAQYFQHELQCLQRQISELSSNQNSRCAAFVRPGPSADPFLEQAADLEAHVNRIQAASLSHLSEMMRRSRTFNSVASCDAGSAIAGATSPAAAVQDQLTLPSGPLFWNLFNSLRTDVDKVTAQIDTFEQRTCDLEDRIDAFDPARFTPPRSVASSNVHNENADCSSPELPIVQQVSELASDAVSPDDADAGRKLMPILTDANWGGHVQQTFPLPRLACLDHSSFGCAHQQKKPVSLNNSEHDPLARSAEYCGERTIDERATSRLATVEKPLQAVPYVVRPKDIVSGDNWLAVGAEGIAFRDREIARMDEQLRIVQERLKQSEETVVHREQVAGEWTAERGGLQTRIIDLTTANAQLEQQMVEYADRLANQADQMRRWKTSWAQAERAYRMTADEKQQTRRSLDTAVTDLARLKVVNNDLRTTLRETAQSLMEQSEDVSKLQYFCEEKDAVIYRQEEIITRGAQLLQQRDIDIEASADHLRSVVDDKEHVVREHLRTARLLEEAKQELIRCNANANITQPNPGQPGSSDTGGRDQPGEASVCGLSQAAARAREDVLARTQWSESQKAGPDAFPEEQRNDESCATDQNESRHTQANASKHADRNVKVSDQTDSHGGCSHGTEPVVEYIEAKRPTPTQNGEHGIRHLLTNDGGFAVKRNEKCSSERSKRRGPDRQSSWATPRFEQRRSSPSRQEWPRGLPETYHDHNGVGSRESFSRRRSRLEDDASLHPPLPMRVKARRMASEADLRRAPLRQPADDAAAGHSMSKHRSMQDLGQRRLQACVETETESGAEETGMGKGGEDGCV